MTTWTMGPDIITENTFTTGAYVIKADKCTAGKCII